MKKNRFFEICSFFCAGNLIYEKNKYRKSTYLFWQYGIIKANKEGEYVYGENYNS